jgi:hypothetical protein
MNTFASPEGQELVQSIVQACQDGRAADAEAAWEQLQSLGPLPEGAEVIPVFIMLCRGQTLEALQFMNGQPDDFFPEVRALCLHMAGDPTWHSHAAALQDNSPDPLVREAMQRMLQPGGQHAACR